MKIVLLSGGSGKRLWPLSSDNRSKQFLKVLQDENGNPESMIQRIYRQIRKSCPDTEMVVASSESQKDAIWRQLGSKVETVLEPSRRNTYPAILLSGAYLIDKKHTPDDEAIAVIPVDPYVDQAYFDQMAKMGQALDDSGADLCLMGIEPTYPSEKYGYILREAETPQGYSPVIRMQEKPTLERAKELLNQGALWNGGVFVFKAGFIRRLIEKEIGVVSFDLLYQKYETIKKDSFDYEVVEKLDSIVCVTYSGEWNDLGTWNTLTEKMKDPDGGYVIRGENCENTHVVNELGIPVVALGLKDTVVVASADGILVSDKGASSYLKPYVEKINARPMYERRQWGEYKVLDYDKHSSNENSLTKRLHIEPGKALSYQLHHNRDEIWTVVDGEGTFLLDGKRRDVSRGDVLYIRKEQKHSVATKVGISLIETQIGTELIEEDIERFDWDWSKEL